MRRRAEKAYLKGNKFQDDARSGYDPIRASLNYNVNQRQDIFATPDKKKRDIARLYQTHDGLEHIEPNNKHQEGHAPHWDSCVPNLSF